MLHPAPLNQMFGRYELLTLLARGGMAEVFLARMSGVGGFAKLLVIKRILPHLLGDPEFVEMFQNEGRIAARLSHANVCQVYELGEVSGDLFLAMEYLDGLAWSDVVTLVPRGRGFELRCAAAVICQICEGLRYAHELRDVDGTPTPVVHRDVSPQNLMITTDGVCKLLDFGVSKVLTEGSRTRTGMLKGKLPYMAPEQIRGEAVDPRADVFSMGVVLWEALTGDRLFRRDSDYLIWRAITEDAIPLVTSKQPSLPPAIDAVVGRALERDPQRRYPSIRMFATELRQVADQVGGPLDPATLSDFLRSVGAPQLAERAERVARAVGRPLRETRSPPEAPIAALAITEPNPVVEPSDTKHSIALRDAPVRLGRRRRRRWPGLLGAALVMASTGVLAAVWTIDDDVATAAAERDAGALAVGVTADAGPELSASAGDAGLAALEIEPDEIEILDDDGAGSDDGSAGASAADAGVKRRVIRRSRKRGNPDPAEAEPGQYSIDSKPYAKIFIDGKPYGATPLFKVSLAPGRHLVRAVRADGKVRRLRITIEPGKLYSSGTLSW